MINEARVYVKLFTPQGVCLTSHELLGELAPDAAIQDLPQILRQVRTCLNSLRQKGYVAERERALSPAKLRAGHKVEKEYVLTKEGAENYCEYLEQASFSF